MADIHRTAEIQQLINGKDSSAASIADMWTQWKLGREVWEQRKLELRKYLTAVDTTQTTNSKLPWKNKTTIPKLTQIRDNLHANYEAAIFPNDDWLRWEGYTNESNTLEKKRAIQAYMSNKIRESGFRQTVNKLLLDYIDYGVAIADVTFMSEQKLDPVSGELVDTFVSPKLVRISPWDHVFDPTATDYRRTPKITRYVKTFGELLLDAKNIHDSNSGWRMDAIARAKELRGMTGRFSHDDFEKVEGFVVDGFTNMYSYLKSGAVELLEFEGDFYDVEADTLLEDYIITVIDRQWIVRMEPNPSWLKGGSKYMVGWRDVPDNLYSMGPLDNLVGMQYRLDHLENLKADAMDLAVFPPVVVQGDVESFKWQPLEVIEAGEDGSVNELGKNLNGVIAAASEMQTLMNLMEEMAGAPKQAMGIRTPGEKTAFEVQTLENAAGRIFQSKVTKFEIHLLEGVLNSMLEISKRMMNATDVVRVLDDDLGVERFLQITKEDITAKGLLRPIGARHFAARAQLVQNLVQLSNTTVWQQIAPHISSKSLATLVEDQLNLNRWQLFEPHIGIVEQLETQRLVQEGQIKLEEEAVTNVNEDI